MTSIMHKGLTGIPLVALFLCLNPLKLLCQNPAILGSIEGRITGLPVNGGQQPVVIAAHLKGASNPERTTVDIKGNYLIHDLPLDTYTVIAVDPGNGRSLSRTVTLSSLRPQNTVDFLFMQPGSVSGTVVDENDRPVAGANISLFSRSYVRGDVTMESRGQAITDDAGRYELSGVDPDRIYYLHARKVLDRGGQVHELTAAWYSNSRSAVGAAPVSVFPGQERPDTNIRVRKVQTRCLSATLTEAGHPAAIMLLAEEDGADIRGLPLFSRKSGSDGKIKACGFVPGTQTLTAVRFGTKDVPPAVGRRSVTIGEEDITDLKIDAAPPVSIRGLFSWAARPPDPIPTVQGQIFLQAAHDIHFEGQDRGASLEISKEFALSVSPGEYAPQASVSGQRGLYIKDITWAGQSVLNSRLTIGSETPASELRILVATDGATIETHVVDDRGDPASDVTVVVTPADTPTESSFSARLIKGHTDQFGAWTSSAQKPGRYKVAAIPFVLDEDVDAISRAWRSMQDAETIELEPGNTLSVNLKIKGH